MLGIKFFMISVKVFLIIHPEVRKTIEEELTANVLTEDYSFSDAYMMIGSFPYGDGEINSNLLILEKETALSRSIEFSL